MDTHTYLTDLSDAEWRVVQPLLPPEKQVARTRRAVSLMQARDGKDSGIAAHDCRAVSHTDADCCSRFAVSFAVNTRVPACAVNPLFANETRD